MSSAFRVGITPDFYSEAKGHFEQVVEEKLGSAGLEVCPMPAMPGNVATCEVIDEYDAILALALKFTAESLRGVRRLTGISRWGVGYDMIDTRACSDAAVALAITPGAVRRPVAEAVIAFVFALSSNLLQQDRMVREGRWRGDLVRLGRNVRNRVLGSLGLGNIAGEVFRMAQSLGFSRLIAADPFVDASVAVGLGVELVSTEELFESSDYLSVNVPLSDGTRGFVGEFLLRRMKPTAYLINTSRGPIVDERALIRALQEHWIAGAGLDVFEVEPLAADSPLRELDNVILTPHGLAWTEELAHDNSVEACENILRLSAGETPGCVVNRDVLENAEFQRKLAKFRSEA